MTYDYVCTACQHVWEAEQRISEDPLKQCPKCRKNTARRQVSGGQGFILKGGGWYADGYGSAPAAKSEAKSETKSDSKSESKSDSKSDGKTAAAGGDSAKKPAATDKKPEKKSEKAA